MASRPLDDQPQRDLRKMVDQNVGAIVELRARAQSEMGRSEKQLSAFVHKLGSPAALFIVLGFIAAWLLANLVLALAGARPFDPPPFPGLQTTLAAAALVTSLVVLIGQNRQGRIREHREELDLQLTLLVEQRTAKLVQLLEELRRDLPDMDAHTEREIRAMARSADTMAIVSAIEEAIARADREAGITGYFTESETADEHPDDA